MRNYLSRLFLVTLLTIGCNYVKGATVQFEYNSIFYEIVSEEEATVEVCSPYNRPDDWYNYFSGLVNIPATVVYNGKTYTVEAIAKEAFRAQRNMTGVVIPKTVKEIRVRAFWGVPLKSVAMASNGVLTRIEKEAFYSTSISSITFPNSLTYIGEDAFKECESLKSIKGGESIETIDNNAFQGCISLTEFTCPNSLKTIGDNAFWGCKSLRTVTMNEGLETIGNDAFLECVVLENVNWSQTVKTLGWEVFRWCLNLRSIEIPNSVVSMDYGTFRYCTGLEYVKLSNAITKIPGWCFEQTAIKSIEIPNSVTTILPFAFRDCASLETIQWGNSLETIGSEAFTGTPLQSLVLPEPLKEIGGYAFAKCNSLTEVTIPNSVIRITDGAFQESHLLKNVWCLAITPPVIPYGNCPFAFCDTPVNVHIFEGLKDDYESSIGWSEAIQKGHITLVDDMPALKVASITIDKEPYYCGIGESGQAIATVLPTNAFKRELSWSSSDDTILFIDEFTGMFVGLDEGIVTITASATDGSGVSASAMVYVGVEPPTAINELVLTPAPSTKGERSSYYSLDGRKLSGKPTQRGLYIKNGRKLVIK